MAATAMVSLVVLGLLVSRAGADERPKLRVCADPNNLPFSNEKGRGFEDELARLVAKDLGATVETTFLAQRRGFLRNTLKKRICDVVMGMPVGLEGVRVTRPYYRSTYVFVTRESDHLSLSSLDDPVLARLRIGVPLVGDDYDNPPPAHALARRGIIDNVVGFTVYGDYADDSPAAAPVRAVGEGKVDVSIVWGPFGGYFAARASKRLTVRAVKEESDAGMPLTFSIGMAVRKDDVALSSRLDRFIVERRLAIDAVLDRFGIVRLPLPKGSPEAAP
jgi:mxaJ protein